MTEHDPEGRGLVITRPVGATGAERAAIARSIVDAATYMTLATADAGGVPWASPVWFATDDHRELVWVSDPRARHSRNIAARPQVAIVIFDSRATPGAGQAVYMAARAEEVTANTLERCLETFSSASVRGGEAAWTAADVRAPARHRLYRAVASEHFVLGEVDERVRVDIGA
jgi:nitroimidazol reductase NimA-like FMN-containing flavoprotein (pyridoxamine 5'-phosphate oxidase superfamily)